MLYKTYIMHYTPLKDRYEFMVQQLSSKGIKEFEFVTDFDKEELTEQITSQYYNQDADAHEKTSMISMRGETYRYRKMRIQELSLAIKHVSAFRKFAGQEKEFGLFLEDDCRFYKDGVSIEDLINNSPPDWDVIFIGGLFDHNICKYESGYKWGDSWYLKAEHPSTNTASSILYKKSTMPKILPYLSPFCLPFDWQLNHVFHMAELNVYHIYPYLCTQGDFESTLGHEQKIE
jgi:GR25 family glycosyltransferase involved in LPS biosynthesis